MKTTLDLPDDLVLRVKMRVVQEGKKLKDAVAEWLERGMAKESTKRRCIPKPAKLKGRGPLTIEEIEAAIADGRA